MRLAPIFRQAASGLSTLLAIVAVQSAIAQESTAPEMVVDPPGRVARLSYIEGAVSLAPADSGDWAEAVLNRPLTSGDALWLDDDARAELEVGSATIHLDHGTSFGVIHLDDALMQMSLTDGAATMRVRDLAERDTIRVETPNASVLLRRPGEYHVETDARGDWTVVKARSGEAEITGGARSYVVRANQEGIFTGLEDLRAQIRPIGLRTAFETWASERARSEDRSVSSRYVSREVLGYEDLDDHGEWLYEPSYGHVWRPLHVAHGWAPYRFGHWVWIGPWGWTWIDDARWGFAPFHYGRWAYLRNSWCWVPGPRHVRPVYAPALVRWVGRPPARYAASFGRDIAWFPLAPHEVYVPGYRHTPRHIRRVNLSNTVIADDSQITRAYTSGDRQRDYRHRDAADAVTDLRQNRFTGSQPVGDRRLRLSEREPSDRVAEREPPAVRAAGNPGRALPQSSFTPPTQARPRPSPQGSPPAAGRSGSDAAGESAPSQGSQSRSASRPRYHQQ